MRLDLFAGRCVDQVAVVGGDLLVQAPGGVRQQVPVLVHRAALDGTPSHTAAMALSSPRCSLEDEEPGVAWDRAGPSSTLRQASALSPRILLIASSTFWQSARTPSTTAARSR